MPLTSQPYVCRSVCLSHAGIVPTYYQAFVSPWTEETAIW